MNLTSSYLGLQLANPFIVGAGPLSEDIGMARRLEDSGASAIVMHSIFEEQVTREQFGTIMDMEMGSESFGEALSYFPKPNEYRLDTEPYLEQIRKLKAALKIPVIASLNGTSPSGWLDYAKKIQQAGADALELNIYYLPTDPSEGGGDVERRTLDIVRSVKREVKLPVAVKLSPFFSAMPHLAKELEAAGADALVLFNRFYQPDIDIESLEAVPSLKLSDSSELLLRLRWLAILHGKVRIPMVITGGVHTTQDAIKAIMAGARAVQMVSALLREGPSLLSRMREELVRWMEDHEYESLSRMEGSMSLQRSPNPGAFERANYMRVLTGWRASA